MSKFISMGKLQDSRVDFFSDGLHNFVTLMAESALSYEEASINAHGTEQIDRDIRNVTKATVRMSRGICNELEKALHNLNMIPETYRGKKFYRINDVFRFYKYTDGCYFRPHTDGSIKLGQSINSEEVEQESQLTVLIYLTNNETGNTILYPNGYDDLYICTRIKPKVGSVVVFDHNILHEAEEVLNETKLVLRTDLFYRRYNILT